MNRSVPTSFLLSCRFITWRIAIFFHVSLVKFMLPRLQYSIKNCVFTVILIIRSDYNAVHIIYYPNEQKRQPSHRTLNITVLCRRSCITSIIQVVMVADFESAPGSHASLSPTVGELFPTWGTLVILTWTFRNQGYLKKWLMADKVMPKAQFKTRAVAQ